MNKLFFTALFTIAILTTNIFSQSKTFFQTIEGKWQGTLEYLDYSSNERVKLKTFVVIKASTDGNSAEIFTTYDDFGKILRDGETERIDLAAKKFFIGEEEFAIESIENGKIVLLGSGEDGEKIEPFRKTITYTDDSLKVLKETRTPWQFRNELILKRVRDNPETERVFSVKELKEDFAVLKRVLVELHPGLYRYNTPAEMEKKFDAFEAKLNEPLTDSEFFKLFAQMISEVKCYHTYPNPLSQTDEIKNGLLNRRNYFPFYFQMIGRKMIITENASSKNLSRGSKITKINGVPTGEVIEQLLTATYADGKGTIEHRLKTLEQKRFDAETDSIFDMIFPLFFPPKDDVYKIEAVDFKTKKKTEFEVLAMTKAERTEEMAKRYGKAPNYEDGWKFEILDDKTAYLKMDHFQTWRLSFKIEPFLADAFAQLRAKNIKNLIIDIRGSGGGYDGVYRETFRYLAKKPLPCNSGTKFYFNTPKADEDLLKYASSWDPSFKENLAKGYPESMYRKADNGLLELIDDSDPCKPYQPYENNFHGKTYLLVSSKNASAAFTLPFYAKKYNLATLVGQETGGNLRGFNGSLYLSIVLPNSKFEFDISLLASVIDPNAEDSGVIPDVYVKQQPEDVGNNFDRELETAKALIKKDQK
jgi:C-terminal processing protease CtpA/Prc